MKKLFTLMAGVLLGAGMAGAAVASDIVLPQNVQLTEEGRLFLQQEKTRLEASLLANESVGDVKKVYQDRNGVIWNAQFLKEKTRLNEILADGDGNPLTWEQCPFYIVAYLLQQYDEDQRPTSQVLQFLGWPSYYIWNQYWQWDGPVENDDVPLADRNYEIVDFEEFCNDEAWQSKSFTITGGWLPGFTNEGVASTWIALPMELLELTSQWQGDEGYTTTNSKLTLGEYDTTERVMNIENLLILKLPTKTTTVRCNYSGTGRLEGFNPTEYAPAMGQIHILNRGVVNSESIDNPYYQDWSDLQRYMIFAPGKYLDVMFPYPGESIEKNLTDWTFGWQSDELSVPDNASYFYGYLYSAVGQEPNECEWILTDPEEKTIQDGKDTYSYYDWLPTAGTFHSALYDDAWSDEYGVITFIESYAVQSDAGTKITIGSKMGSGLYGIDFYGNVNDLMAKEGKVIYHYDENNISNVREYPAVGNFNFDFDNVADVAAEMGVKVAAANGAINVVAAEEADVTVFALNGAVVKSAKLAAGESMSLKADKGLYIVKAGKNAVKVVL